MKRGRVSGADGAERAREALDVSDLRIRPPALARSTRRCASAREVGIGFSTSTSRPASSRKPARARVRRSAPRRRPRGFADDALERLEHRHAVLAGDLAGARGIDVGRPRRRSRPHAQRAALSPWSRPM
jgi:hypothetical protein